MNEKRIFPKENNIMRHVEGQVESFCLYSGVWSVNLKFPKTNRGIAIAVSQSPTVKKVLPAHSAIFHAPSGIVSVGRRVSIGRPATSGIREDRQSRLDWGALYGLPLFLIPKLTEVSYVPEF